MDPESTVGTPAESRRKYRARIVNLFCIVGSWFSRLWADIRPGQEARRGAAWGSISAAVLGAIIAGRYLRTGFGLWVDFALCFAAGAFIILLSILLVPPALTILRKLPRLASGLIFGSVIVILLAFFPVGILAGPVACLSAGLLGAAIATLLHRNFGRATAKKKVIAITLIVLSLAAIAGEIAFLASDGSLEGLMKVQLKSPQPEALRAANPGEPGRYKIRMVYYGAKGGNPRRPEYNHPTIATPAVDASKFFKEFKGWKRNLRKKYWGYDFDKLPLNATVWIPEGPGTFPLVLIVHGNHEMAEFSDPGYRYLGELLASRGFILASVDENFLNGGLLSDPPNQQAVRGWMLLEHLKLWRDWSRNPHNPLGVAIDFDRIAVMGHSRGGEAAATAALFNNMEHYPEDASIRFDYHFPIRSVVAIAPADGQYRPAGQWRWIENVNYFTLQGANDSDVCFFMGSRQWDHVRYALNGDWFKSELYIYRANHGQFNTVWGRSDFGYPLGWFLNLKPLMDPEDQRRIARIYLSAFLEATLHGRREYLPLFRDYRCIRSWLPETLYMNRYEDAGYKLVADFNEDPDLSSTTLPGGRIDAKDLSMWKEGRIPFRSGDREYNGAFLGWNREDEKGKEDSKIRPAYTITLPENISSAWKLTSASVLSLSLAALDEDAPLLNAKEDKPDEKAKKESQKEREAPDFTIELGMADGAVVERPLSQFGPLLPPVKVRFTKLQLIDDLVYQKASEPVFQTISIPLSSYAGQNGFDPGKLKTIRLRFDRTRASVILLSKIGFEVH